MAFGEVHQQLLSVIQKNQRLAMGWYALHEEFFELYDVEFPEFLEIRVNQRIWMGWGDVHEEIANVPFCEKRSRGTKVLFCRICNECSLNGLCEVCYKKGEKHNLGYPVYNENDYPENFKKFY